MFERYPKRSPYKHAKQKKYDVRNWAEYNQGLRRRGDLTWFDEEAIANWTADKFGGQSRAGRRWCTSSPTDKPKASHSIASLLGIGIPGLLDVCVGARGCSKSSCGAASNQP